ncbi:MAG TPA: alpha/beta hydrolase [Legionella sp.]|nr:alpha/beta hydrolase [Legionella sp.]
MNELKLTIPGLTIACKAWGNPANPPIVAFHGWLDNANSFDKMALYLESQYYFIAVDLPGHGLSSHLAPGSHYHFIDGVFTLIQIINALNLNKVHLLGHSLGACLASLAAGIAPERFLSLNLIEGLGPFTHPAETACKQLSKYLENLTHKKSNKKNQAFTFESAVNARATKGYVSLDIAKQLCERGVIEDNGLFSWRHDRRLLIPSPLQMTEEQVLSCLREITAKTCLFSASKGFSFNYDLLQKRIKAVRNLRIHHLTGGHHIHMEQPEVIAKLLAAFIAD